MKVLTTGSFLKKNIRGRAIGEAAGCYQNPNRSQALEKAAQVVGAAYPVSTPEARSKTLSPCTVFPMNSTDKASVLADKRKNI